MKENNENDMHYIFPLFKFLTKKNTQKLLDRGSVRIGTLYDYRKEEKYKGKILDKDEGRKKIILRPPNGIYKADELCQLGLPISGQGIMDMGNSVFVMQQESPDCYLYPTSSAFFTDSLFQSVEEDEKNSCILIKDPELFFEKISKAKEMKDSEYRGFHPCKYIGREFEIQNMGKRDPVVDFHPALLKPSGYKDHREVRAIWEPKNTMPIEPKTFEIPQLSDLCIEISFDELDINLLKEYKEKNKECIVGCQIHKKRGDDAYFDIKYPFEIFTPVIVGTGSNGLVLGFLAQTQTQTYENPTVSNSEIGIMISDIGSIFCCNHLDGIKGISYFTKSKNIGASRLIY